MVTDTPRRQPTLDEVAARAGVSRAAVSRVVNNAPYVSAAKRQVIEQAIRDLGYVPNRAARALATQRNGNVVLAVSLADPGVFADPFFAQIIAGVSAALEETELHLLICLAASARGEARLKNLLSTQGVDGIMALSVRGEGDPLIQIVESSGLPSVYCGRPLDREPRWYVDADNYGGTRAAVEHLIERGRTRIATIAGPPGFRNTQTRSRAFHDALTIAGLSPHGVVESDFTEPGGAQAMRALLERDPDLDAVFVANDNMALGALAALRELGRRVPEDVAVVGFDDVRPASITDPPLTTVRQSIEALGRETARMLAQVLQGGQPSPVILPTTLVRRAST